MTQNTNEFVSQLEALTKEPVWMTILGLAGEGLIVLPDWVRDKLTHTLEGMKERGIKHLPYEEALRVVRRLQDALAVCGGTREVFLSFIESGGHKREDGSLMTYREIADLFGNYHDPRTIHRWMRHHFPEVAKEMRQDHLH